MAKIKFISIEQLLEMMENKDKFKLVEVLSEGSFKEGHIPEAINIPVDQLEKVAKNKLKKTDRIVV